MNGKIRYYLIACGTSHYKNYDDDKQLASVETDIGKVVNLFTHNFGYEQVLTDLQLNPKLDEIKKQFAEWLQNKERCETDRVIFYYSGHGESVQGDKHYLVMEDTEPNKMPQTSLATEELVRPLNNEGVKISQILYIIDTCYSQSGAGDVTEFASSVIQQYQKVKRATNIAVYTIAACSAKQLAEEGVFSNALKEILEERTKNELNLKFIDPNELVEEINRKISSETQCVKYSVIGSATSPKFLPILPKTLQKWEEKRHEFIEKLFDILKVENDHSLFYINSFLLSGRFVKEFSGNGFEEFVADEQGLQEKLSKFARKPVSNGICRLIAISEWCRLRFSDRDSPQSTQNIASGRIVKIKNWQNDVIKYRKEVDLDKIEEVTAQALNKFKEYIREADLRIQIQIALQKDEENGTGNNTGAFLFNMNLWIESEDSPIGMFARNELLEPQGSDKSVRLQSCLQETDFLPNLIREARYSLPEKAKPKIEFFLPFDFYQESLEQISFQSGRRKKALGVEYPIFINSFERHFDKDFREIRDEIDQIKKALWNDNNNDNKYYYIGTEPSKSNLQDIEEAKAIAVWSRCGEKPLNNHINISQWKEWPQKVHELRQNNNDMEVTLFWDDLYPKLKPSLLNTKVVE